MKKTITYGIGTFGSKVLIFLLVPIYSYFVDKEAFGYYDIVNSTMGLIVPFITLQVSDSLFRWLIEKKESKIQIEKAVTNSLIILVFGIIFISFLSIIIYILYPLKYQLLITVMFVFAMIYPYLQQLVRGMGYSKLFAVNGVLYSLTYLVANVIFVVLLKKGVEGIFLSVILAFFVASLLIIRKINFVKLINLKLISSLEIKAMISYSLPLVPNSVSWWLVNSANKYIVLIFLGVSYNGIYAMSNRFPIILVMISQIFTLAWQEQAISEFDKDKSEENANVLKNLIKTQFTLVIIFSLLSKLTVETLLSHEYLDSWRYMPLIYLSSAFNSFASYYGAFYLASKKTKSIFITSFLGGFISIILGFILVKPFGLMGISLSTLIGYLVLFMVRKQSVKKITSIGATNNTLYKYGVIVLLSFIIVYIEKHLLYTLISLFIFLFYIIYENKKVIKNVLHFKK